MHWMHFYGTTSRSTLEILLKGSSKMRAMLPIIPSPPAWTMFPAEQVYVAAVMHEANIQIPFSTLDWAQLREAKQCMTGLRITRTHECQDLDQSCVLYSRVFSDQVVFRSCWLFFLSRTFRRCPVRFSASVVV
jgi:hypothetical protein